MKEEKVIAFFCVNIDDDCHSKVTPKNWFCIRDPGCWWRMLFCGYILQLLILVIYQVKVCFLDQKYSNSLTLQYECISVFYKVPTSVLHADLYWEYWAVISGMELSENMAAPNICFISEMHVRQDKEWRSVKWKCLMHVLLSGITWDL